MNILVEEDNDLQSIGNSDRNLQQNKFSNVIPCYLASGGYSGIYKRNTGGNSFFGNVLTKAYRAGIGLTDLGNLYSFHPTVFIKEGFEALLMSEAIRGEGAILLNPHHERFMERYHPNAELAS